MTFVQGYLSYHDIIVPESVLTCQYRRYISATADCTPVMSGPVASNASTRRLYCRLPCLVKSWCSAQSRMALSSAISLSLSLLPVALNIIFVFTHLFIYLFRSTYPHFLWITAGISAGQSPDGYPTRSGALSLVKRALALPNSISRA